MAQVGRIGGGLLSADLVRNGVDLSFDTDLLYLDVNNNRIGIKTDGPTAELNVDGNSFINGNTSATTTAKFGSVALDNVSGFSTTVGEINLRPTGPDAYIEWGKALTPKYKIKDNTFSITETNGNLELSASGTGTVSFLANTAVDGDVEVTQNVEVTKNLIFYGNIIVGDSPLDTIAVNPDFKQSIVPGASGTYSLGSDTKRWSGVYLTGIAGVDSTTVDALITSDQVRTSGNTITTIQSNDTLVINSDTGNLYLENFLINGSTITNLNSVTPITVSSTGTGYYRFTGNTGLVFPAGDTSERSVDEVGATRWNTEFGYLECFDGETWQIATGGGKVVTPEIMEDLGRVYSLIFG